jgi:membrane-associated protease RseP (regulator of RpoE activity)
MILLIIILLIPIIIIHELGHLFAAKFVGCKVEVFSIGFGKPIYSFDYRDIRYNITPYLFGGYCKVEGETTQSTSPTAFCNLTYRKKLILILAGCTVNLIVGSLSLLLFYSGIHNYPLFLFGYLNVTLGITNLIPIAPCLDGGYVVYLPICLKIWGKEKGFEIFSKASRISFTILMALQILLIPWMIMLLIRR